MSNLPPISTSYTPGNGAPSRAHLSCHRLWRWSLTHSGRLWIQYQRQEVTKEKIRHIYSRGFKLLQVYALKPFWGTACQWLLLNGYNEKDAIQIVSEKGLFPKITNSAEWQEWRLVLNGKEYRSRFKNIVEWSAFYAKK